MDDDFISLRPSEVPEYLTDSDFYNCLNIDSDEEFSIAKKHLKRDVTIDSDASLRYILSTMQFWGSNSTPSTVFDYLMANVNLRCPDWLSEYERAFPVLVDIKEVCLSTPKRRTTVAARSESYEFFTYVVSNNDHLSTLALSEAAVYGRFKNLQFAYLILSGNNRNPLVQVHCNHAAENGHVDCLQFLHENGSPLNKLTCPAAGNGHLDCLKFAHENGFPWDNGTVRAALAGGHLNCVIYAQQNGCPWPRNGSQVAAEHGHMDCLKYALDLTGEQSPQLAVAACRGGNLECLRFLVEQCYCKLSVQASTAAAAGGHLTCLQYLHEQGCRANDCASHAALHGEHWECLRFLLTHKPDLAVSFVFITIAQDCAKGLDILRECDYPIPASITAVAVRHNSIKCLQYLHDHALLHWGIDVAVEAVSIDAMDALRFAVKHGCPLDARATALAASNGNLQALTVLGDAGCPWDETACVAATEAINLECLQYLHEHGCPWDERSCVAAAMVEYVEGLKFLHEHGCPWDEQTLVVAAEQCVHGSFRYCAINCLKYASEHGCPWSVGAARVLARDHSNDLLSYAHEQGCPWDELVSAVARHHPRNLEYCVEHGCPISAETMQAYNALKGRAAQQATRAGHGASIYFITVMDANSASENEAED